MSDKLLGFERQPRGEGSCGTYALGHALNLVGITGEIQNLKSSTNYVSWSESAEKYPLLVTLLRPKFMFNVISDDVGTDEIGIPQGIKKSGCIPISIDNYSKPTSRKILDSNLKKGFPVILFANWDKDEDDDGHWYVCAGRADNNYIMIDSTPRLVGKNIISLYTWTEIAKRSNVCGDNGSYFQLFGFAVQSPDSVSAVARLHKYLNQLFKDNYLKNMWGYYLNDLRNIFDTTGKTKNVITSKDFFSKYGPSFIENTRYRNSAISKSKVEKELTNYQIVADTYNFAVSKSNLGKALIGFTSAIITTSQFE